MISQHQSFVYTTSKQAKTLARMLFDHSGQPLVPHGSNREQLGSNPALRAAAAATQLPEAAVRKWLQLHKTKPTAGACVQGVGLGGMNARLAHQHSLLCPHACVSVLRMPAAEGGWGGWLLARTAG